MAGGVGDFDGDGKADVLLRHADGRWQTHLMDGRRAANGGGDVAIFADAVWSFVGVGDLNGDGRDDVLLRHDNGSWRYYPLNGATVAAGAGTANLTRNLDWSVAGIGDFDGDDRDDVLLRHADGRWHYYPMDGRRFVASGRGTANLTRNLDWSVAGIGDFDGDGRDDVLLRKVDGRWHYYPMDGRRFVASGRGTANLTRNLDWSTAGVGDFDGDGRDDVLLRHADGRWYHYAMNGRRFISGTQGAADLPRDLAWRTPDAQQAGSTGDHAVGETFKDCATCPEMVVVPAGTFTMGSPADEDGRWWAEGPQHEVTFAAPFAIGVHEVTFREWDACVADGGCAHEPWDWDWGRSQRPVMDITWGQAQAYVDWLAAETGQPYRLPSEAEWEYAARAGTTTPFHFGATISTDQANYNGTKPPYGDGVAGADRQQTVPVGSFPANAFGLHDVHGNVAEWVQDCGSDENWGYDDAPADGSAVEIAGCRKRLSRGGGWWDEAAKLRSASRGFSDFEDWFGSNLGFRVARGVSGTAPGDGTVVGIDAPELGVWLTTTTEVFVEWSAVENATHYQLYLHRTDGTTWKYDPFPAGDGTQRRLLGLMPATEYCFTITALDGDAESPHSARVCATTNAEDAAGPDAPDLRLDRVTETEVFLEWSPVPGATHYRFYSHLADGSTRTYWPFPASEGTRRRFSNLTPDTEYCYTLTALTADAESAHSVRVCATTDGGDTADADPIDDFDVTIPAGCPTQVEVCVRDHQCEDGDEVRVSVNDAVVFSGEIFNHWICENADVRRGRNDIEIYAINGTGFKGASCSHADANTGEIRVRGNGVVTQRWLHAGGRGSTANLNVTVGGAGTCPVEDDDHGDTQATATAAAVPSTTAGRLETATDNDYFRLEVGGSGRLTVYTEGSIDTVGALTRGDTGDTRTNDDGGTGGNFRIEEEVTAGTYYVRVGGYGTATGDYTLQVEFDGSAGGAPDAPMPDVDRVTATEVFLIWPAVPNATHYKVYYHPSAGRTIEFGPYPSSEVPPFRHYDLQPRTEYCYTVAALNGNAESDQSERVCATTDGGDTGDDGDDTRAGARALPLGTAAQGTLDDAGDVDYWRIEVPARGRVTIETTGGTDTFGRVEDSSGNELARDDDGGAGSNFRLELDLDVGTYYVRVEGASGAVGPYRLQASHVPDRGETGVGVVNFVGLGNFCGTDIWISDGERWQFVHEAAGCLNDVAYGDGQWIAVGNDGQVLTSEGGRTWTQGHSDFGLAGIAYGQGRWVAVGYDAILTSVDGTNWTRVFGQDWEDQDPNLIAFNASTVAYGDGLWVAAGVNDIFESTDGTNWATVSAEKTRGCGDAFEAVAYGNGHWHAVGIYGVCRRGPSGDWFRFLTRSQTGGLDDVGYGNGHWIAAGERGMFIWPEVGDTLWRVTVDCDSIYLSIRAVGYGHGRWIAGPGGFPAYNTGDPKVPGDWSCFARDVIEGGSRLGLKAIGVRP